jgi:prepilin-type N-terminal cleavage/methylation domain-containing protein
MKTRRGYTLLELLLVVAILVVLTAVAWPALRSPWGRARIEEAGHAVRVALARVRVEAIESAMPYQFRFQPGTGTYEYGPAPALGGRNAETALAAFDPDAADSESADPEDLAVEEDLPEGVRFVDPESAALRVAGSVVLDAPAYAESAATSGAAEWSAPIVFYPNGRSLSARLTLVAPDGRMVDVVLRGLTGTAKVGKPYQPRTDELRGNPDTFRNNANEPLESTRAKPPEPQR